MSFFGFDLLSLKASPLALKMESEAQRENWLCFTELFNRFSNIAITRFNWTGLPDSVSERFLNTALYLCGEAAFFQDDELGYLALPCTNGGEFNVYYEPTRVNAFSFNFNRNLQKDEFAYLRATPSACPLAFSVFEYTRRLADILRTLDVLTRKMKQPYLILCDKKEELTYRNLIKKTQDNEIMILGAKEFGINKGNFELIPTPSNADLKTLWESYQNMEQILYTALGINSSAVEKRERLLVDEVNANNMVVEMSTEVVLKELQFSCQRINERYGLNVGVTVKQMSDYTGGEDGGDGEVYNRVAEPD